MQPTDEEQFARNLAQRRTNARMSQSELARRMVDAGWESYSQMTISRTEKGERPIRLGEARALATILRTSLNDMIGVTPDEASVHQAAGVFRDLQESIIAVRNAVSGWKELNETAQAYIDEAEGELPLADPVSDAAMRSHLDAMRMIIFDAWDLLDWALSKDPIDADDGQSLTIDEVNEIRQRRSGDIGDNPRHVYLTGEDKLYVPPGLTLGAWEPAGGEDGSEVR